MLPIAPTCHPDPLLATRDSPDLANYEFRRQALTPS